MSAAPRTEPPLGTPGLWFVALGGMAAYALHLVAGFWLVPVVCATGSRMWLHGLGAVTLSMAVAATVQSVMVLRAAPVSSEGFADEDGGHPLGDRGRRRSPSRERVPDSQVHSVLAALLLGRVRLAAVLLVGAAAALRRRRQRGEAGGAAGGAHRMTEAGLPARVGLASGQVLAGDPGRVRFMAAVGLALNVVAVLLVLTHWAPVPFFDPCA